MASTAVPLLGFFLCLLGFAGAAAATLLLPQRHRAASVGTNIITASGNDSAVEGAPAEQDLCCFSKTIFVISGEVDLHLGSGPHGALPHGLGPGLSVVRDGHEVCVLLAGLIDEAAPGALFSLPWCALPGNSRLDYQRHDYGFL